jgi:hypothetical protein
MYAVEAQFMDKVVAEYGPCMSPNYQFYYTLILSSFSDKSWRYRRRPNVRQNTRTRGL